MQINTRVIKGNTEYTRLIMIMISYLTAKRNRNSFIGLKNLSRNNKKAKYFVRMLYIYVNKKNINQLKKYFHP